MDPEKRPFQVRASIHYVRQQKSSLPSRGRYRPRRWSSRTIVHNINVNYCFCVTLIISRLAVVVVNNRSVTGCRLTEGQLKTDTDREHCSSIYTTYRAPPYRLINTTTQFGVPYWNFVNQTCDHLTHVDRKASLDNYVCSLIIVTSLMLISKFWALISSFMFVSCHFAGLGSLSLIVRWLRSCIQY